MQINLFKETSDYQKDLISVLYRLVLIFYSIAILILKNTRIDFWLTILYFLLFILLFFTLRKKNTIFSRLRLINDYVFIGLTIYNVGEIDLFTLSLIFIPILNSQNHSGQSKSILLYILPLGIIFFINQQIDYFLIIPFVAFFVINSFEYLKNKYQLFYNELNSSIDDFLVEEEALNNLHNIYSRIIPIFNKFTFFPKEIKEIICFEKKFNSLTVINGSTFVFDFKFIDENKIFNNKKNIIYNQELNLNFKETNENVIINVKKNSINYIFLFVLEGKGQTFINKEILNFYKLLLPFLSRLAHIFNFKRIQAIDNKKNINMMAEKVTYVNNAINSMHFTRNKLSPLTTYLYMVNDYESTKSQSRKKMIEPYLIIERKKVRTSLDLILERANFILEKSNNPFNVLESDDYSFLTILGKVREAANYHLDSKHFDFNFDDFDFELDKKVRVNETGLDLVLSNWFSNVNKYKSDYEYGVKINGDSNSYILTFFNNFTRKELHQTPTFIEDFNSSERMAILKRKTHGLVEIKDFLEQMGVKAEMRVENSTIYFKLYFKKITK